MFSDKYAKVTNPVDIFCTFSFTLFWLASLYMTLWIWKTNIWRKTILRYFHLNWRIKKLLQLTPSWWRSLLYRNQSIDLHSKSMDWLLYNSDFRHERVKGRRGTYFKMLLSKLVKWISLIKGVAGNKINI